MRFLNLPFLTADLRPSFTRCKATFLMGEPSYPLSPSFSMDRAYEVPLYRTNALTPVTLSVGLFGRDQQDVGNIVRSFRFVSSSRYQVSSYIKVDLYSVRLRI
ncbi:hypothetical protein V6N13_057128 [Hibiscus sabdariffa]